MRAFGTDKWLALVLSLPTANSTLRIRVWRALKSLGCAVLRDGVYLLPAGRGLRQVLKMYVEEVRQGGGNAFLLSVGTSPGEERADFQGRFDRSGDYERLTAGIAAFESVFPSQETAASRRRLKALRRGLEAVAAVDYFPGPAREEAEDRLSAAETLFFSSLSPGEPSRAADEVEARRPADYRNRLWATRKNIWVDRVASAWLVRRFVDGEARFAWLVAPEDCPAGAVGFDFDSAEFAHVGKRVTFEVLLAAFGLEHDASLRRIGAMVRFLDVGGVPMAEAAGVEMVLSGARRQCPDDDAMLASGLDIFDALYAALAE